MRKFFRYDSGFWAVMGRLFDLIVLNFFWVLTSLPLVTVGASTTALLTMTLRMADGRESERLTDYFRAFSANWKQSTALWLGYAAAFAWLIWGIYVCGNLRFAPLRVLSLVDGALLLLLLLGLQYVFAVQARYDNSLRDSLRLAHHLSLRYLPFSAVMLALLAVPVGLVLAVPEAFPAVLSLATFLGASCMARLQSWLLMKVFRRAEQASDTKT